MPAFERAFGIKTVDLGRLMWRYGRRGMQSLQVMQPGLPSARVSLRTLPRAAGEFLLVDAAMKACPSGPAGESLLRRTVTLAAQFPDADATRLSLGRAQVNWGDPTAALSLLALLLRDEPTARWAMQWRRRLQVGVTRQEILAEMRRGLSSNEALKDWTVDKASVMNQVERSFGLEAAEAFIRDQQHRQTPAAAPAGNTDRR